MVILYLYSNILYQDMFEFDQYLGFLAFLTIVTMGFWIMFLMMLVVIPYWVVGALIERINELLEERKAKK
ncbi:MAG: hypothetical protein CMC85_03160 [Flavobacteriaceae bacterium]|uniref:Uncharacterized protein n=1 Tax=marine metagenome TaxID=408172 RepID=A0A381T7A2_9ZZZZ|nr:hypothetical protein [Flavobacteriaceae bacterium]|tara:strand:- start:1761 stop:1970 length:210 start_codon:yes stop_codon:yes gene_type:complete